MSELRETADALHVLHVDLATVEGRVDGHDVEFVGVAAELKTLKNLLFIHASAIDDKAEDYAKKAEAAKQDAALTRERMEGIDSVLKTIRMRMNGR